MGAVVGPWRRQWFCNSSHGMKNNNSNFSFGFYLSSITTIVAQQLSSVAEMNITTMWAPVNLKVGGPTHTCRLLF
jgi:hypothetical protein